MFASSTFDIGAAGRRGYNGRDLAEIQAEMEEHTSFDEARAAFVRSQMAEHGIDETGMPQDSKLFVFGPPAIASQYNPGSSPKQTDFAESAQLIGASRTSENENVVLLRNFEGGTLPESGIFLPEERSSRHTGFGALASIRLAVIIFFFGTLILCVVALISDVSVGSWIFYSPASAYTPGETEVSSIERESRQHGPKQAAMRNEKQSGNGKDERQQVQPPRKRELGRTKEVAYSSQPDQQEMKRQEQADEQIKDPVVDLDDTSILASIPTMPGTRTLVKPRVDQSGGLQEHEHISSSTERTSTLLEKDASENDATPLTVEINSKQESQSSGDDVTPLMREKSDAVYEYDQADMIILLYFCTTAAGTQEL
ncbi:unnamed protein product [Amoebophrya sp. A25]|nr:unnamed protein product [Amoebophrya sp. A25]|eukprot:GSA25T00018594001.1